MQLSVKGKQIELGDALRTYVAEHLNGTVEKYFDKAIDAQVIFEPDAHLYRCEIIVHTGSRGITLQANAEAPEPYPAFDSAFEKVKKRLRRYSKRLKEHSGPGPAVETLMAARYNVLQADQEEDDLDGAVNGDQPVIVAEMTTNIETLTVGEAVMRMDLADKPAVLFRNRAHGGLNMVYRRPDGNIGWVDPTIGQS